MLPSVGWSGRGVKAVICSYGFLENTSLLHCFKKQAQGSPWTAAVLRGRPSSGTEGEATQGFIVITINPNPMHLTSSRPCGTSM